MDRPFVITSEHGRHPFRRSLPAHVLRPLPTLEPEVLAAQERAEARLSLRSPDVDPRSFNRQNGKDFLLAFLAGFVAFSVWLS
jgi:uncharacterized protein YcbX